MKTTRIITGATLIIASGLALHAVLAQQPATKRIDLQRRSSAMTLP